MRDDGGRIRDPRGPFTTAAHSVVRSRMTTLCSVAGTTISDWRHPSLPCRRAK